MLIRAPRWLKFTVKGYHFSTSTLGYRDGRIIYPNTTYEALDSYWGGSRNPAPPAYQACDAAMHASKTPAEAFFSWPNNEKDDLDKVYVSEVTVYKVPFCALYPYRGKFWGASRRYDKMVELAPGDLLYLRKMQDDDYAFNTYVKNLFE